MVKRGTYTEFLKSKVDIFSLFEKGNEQSEPSPVPGAPSLISESLVQSFKSPRPSLKDAAQEDQEVSFSSCNTPGSVCSWWCHGPSSALLMTSSFVPKQTLRFPKSCSMELVELEEHEGSKPAWGSPLSVGWRILWRPEVGALL